jgi:Zn-dependent membrane protease YugP
VQLPGLSANTFKILKLTYLTLFYEFIIFNVITLPIWKNPASRFLLFLKKLPSTFLIVFSLLALPVELPARFIFFVLLASIYYIYL